MRRRLVVSTIAIVLVVLGALAVPVGLVVYGAAEQQLVARLEQQATAIANLVSADLNAGREPDLDSALEVLGPSDGLQIVAPDGELTTYSVPEDLDSTRVASQIASDGSRIVVVTDASPLDEYFRSQLNILLVLALGALVAAAGLAAVQARQLARPLERLASRAGRVGEGDFSMGPFVRTHIPEIDHIGSALDTSSLRVETMLSAERHFTADATHQLRTGITGIAMRLEILTAHPDAEVAAEAEAALAQTDQLNATIDELLAVARDRADRDRRVFDLAELVDAHVVEWQPRFAAQRRLISMVTSAAAPPVVGTKGLTGQVVDILIHNALRHGGGTVTLMIEGPSVIVIDQGAGVTDDEARHIFDGPVDPAARHGRGLPLARRLAQVDGGSLEVAGVRPLRMKFGLVRATDDDLAGDVTTTSA